MRVLRPATLAALALGLLVNPASAGGVKIPKPPKNSKATLVCPPNSVQVGSICADTYEASVWTIPADDVKLLELVKAGVATPEVLAAGGATQLGAAPDTCTGSEYPAEFPRNGNWTTPLYALSMPGVPPSACISWYQAAQACALAGKRLLTNAEWQMAAAGTPDPGAVDDGVAECNVAGAAAANTGARTLCLSTWLAADMIGNLAEWTADWTENADGCNDLTSEFGDGEVCFGGDPSGNRPFAHTRGGSYLSGRKASVFTVKPFNLETQSKEIGFRCGR